MHTTSVDGRLCDRARVLIAKHRPVGALTTRKDLALSPSRVALDDKCIAVVPHRGRHTGSKPLMLQMPQCAAHTLPSVFRTALCTAELHYALQICSALEPPYV